MKTLNFHKFALIPSLWSVQWLTSGQSSLSDSVRRSEKFARTGSKQMDGQAGRSSLIKEKNNAKSLNKLDEVHVKAINWLH